MSFNINLSSRRRVHLAIVGCLLMVVAGYLLFLAAPTVSSEQAKRAYKPTDLRSSEATGTSSKEGIAWADGINAGGSLATDDKPSGAASNDTPVQIDASLRAIFQKIVNRGNMSQNELDEFRARLQIALENAPEVAKLVTQFYHDMPAEQGMERDILRSILVDSAIGRDIVLQEANAIWEGRNESKYAEMYETYFNMPSQTPQEVFSKALSDLRSDATTDERTAVARLNLIGTLEESGIPDAANLRSEAVQTLNQIADGHDSELIRALAVQKLFRLNSPGEAANIAIGQLSKGAYPDLVRETLNSVSSGDVELTPNLRTALTMAVKRP
ncbi:type II secretory pathway component PulM [Paraburkholderia youngii]|uniref:hypothetical protein n=1 Tax=Paraburkholderia youngii TaxID=2782701 RepID=UPI003D203B8D